MGVNELSSIPVSRASFEKRELSSVEPSLRPAGAVEQGVSGSKGARGPQRKKITRAQRALTVPK